MNRKIAALNLMVGLTLPVAAWAQTSADSTRPPNMWVSLGFGPASSTKGPIGVRAAASTAFSHLLVTYSLTGAGDIDGSVGSNNILIGVRAPIDHGFAFISGGLARTGCPGCAGQTGTAFEGPGFSCPMARTGFEVDSDPPTHRPTALHALLV